MSISLKEFDYRKEHLRYDPKKKKYIGYQIDVRAAGKRYRDTFRTKEAAEQFIAELRTKTVYRKAGIKYETRTDVMLSELFEKRKAAIGNVKERIRAERVFRVFDGLFDSPVRVPDVRTADFRRYINLRIEEGVKPETANREINVISAAFNEAASMFPRELEGYEPPKMARPRISRRKKIKHEITEAEYKAIVAAILSDRSPREQGNRTASRPTAADMFTIGWMLGLRIGELEKLEETDLVGDVLRVVRWKTNDISMIGPLPTEVVEILRRNIAASRSKLIFDLACSRHTFDDIIRQACATAGVKYGRGEFDAVTFHSTRHSFTSRLVRVTDIATARSFTGHSSDEMVEYYAHASDEQRKLAMSKMFGADRTKELRSIFKKVSTGKMSETEFLEALK